MNSISKYHGVTYPTFFIRWNWQLWLWRKVMCCREIHLFDEVLSSSDIPWPHYLVCDACELEIHIERIDETHRVVRKTRLERE